jgi:predicted amidophosphoribosyltransferase
MALIADCLAEQTGLQAVPLLTKRVRADQRRLNRKERQYNTEELFSLISQEREGIEREAPVLLRTARIILIDDVFTTGATLNAATQVLRAAGVTEIRVATLARVW